MTDSVSQFFAAWAEPDDAARDRQILGALGASIFYADPRTPAPLTHAQDVAAYVGNSPRPPRAGR
jgi:hypothetical protein